MIATLRHWNIASVSACIFYAWLLAACQDSVFSQKVLNGSFRANQQKNYPDERYVEAPDFFRASEAGFWDDRSSLVGIWITHSETDIPERVIIRNASNKKFVIGAFFRRNTTSPGPRLVLSTVSVEALGMSAGVPANLVAVALLKRSISESTPEQSGSETGATSGETKVSSPKPTSTPPTSTTPPVKLVHFDKKKRFIQSGIFGRKQDAKITAESMLRTGIVPNIKTYKRSDQTFWRVLVGSASTTEEQMNLFQKVKTVGFNDAYAVTS